MYGQCLRHGKSPAYQPIGARPVPGREYKHRINRNLRTGCSPNLTCRWPDGARPRPQKMPPILCTANAFGMVNPLAYQAIGARHVPGREYKHRINRNLRTGCSPDSGCRKQVVIYGIYRFVP